MEEALSRTASNLLPLLLLLGVIFGILITLALLLRFKVRSETRRRPVRRRRSPAELQPGDLFSVLGRTYAVEAVETFTAGEDAALWCVLGGEAGPARCLLGRDGRWALHFPGSEAAPAEPGFPERIERESGACDRQGGPWQAAPGLELARYRCAGPLRLMIEARGEQRSLWRGKEVPVEGLVVLEEGDQQ
jgi:hypothetical protein